MGIMANEDTTAGADKTTSEGNWESSRKHNTKPNTESKNQEDLHGRISVHESKVEVTCQQNVLTAKRDPSNSRDNVTNSSTVVPNVTQDVLFQLIEAGHLQVHTEEDGSGHQYVAIPLPPSTADLMHSSRSTSDDVLCRTNGEKLQRIVSKRTSPAITIKEELE